MWQANLNFRTPVFVALARTQRNGSSLEEEEAVEKRLPLDLTHMEWLVPGALARVGGDSRIGAAEAKRAGKALSRWKGLILADTGASIWRFWTGPTSQSV